jgi:hypothetical protein
MKRYIINLTISFVLIVFGIILSIFELLDFSIKDRFDDQTLSSKTGSYDFIINKELIEIDTSAIGKSDIIYNNNITPGSLKVEVTYYNNLLEIDKFSLVRNDREIVYFALDKVDDFNTAKKLIKITLDGLKKKTLYNYAEAVLPEIRIYINKVDSDSIMVRN